MKEVGNLDLLSQNKEKIEFTLDTSIDNLINFNPFYRTFNWERGRAGYGRDKILLIEVHYRDEITVCKYGVCGYG